MKPITEVGALRAFLADIRRAALGPVLFRLHDGEEWVHDTPTDNGEQIVRDANSTGEDLLEVSTPAGSVLGKFWLVWGNAEDGEELIADYVVSPFADQAWDLFHRRYA